MRIIYSEIGNEKAREDSKEWRKVEGGGQNGREKRIGETFKWLVCRLSRLVPERANITKRSVCADPANRRLK